MIEWLAFAVVVLAALYFLVLATLLLLAPSRAGRFLLGFAGSPVSHYAELTLRLVVGGGFVLHAPRMVFADAFLLFGWVLLLTTVCLLPLPWQWHRRFAQQAVPRALRHVTLIGVSSALLGALVLYAAFGKLPG